MPKFQSDAARFALRPPATPFREVCVPLYLPAIGPRELSVPREIDAEELVVDAAGISVGGDDEVDDDGY